MPRVKEADIQSLEPEYPYAEPRVRAVVLFSGGLDSLSSLLWAIKRYSDVTALSFRYGQRHATELKAAKKIVGMIRSFQGVRPVVHHQIVNVPALQELSGGGLVEDGAPLWERPKRGPRQLAGSIFVPCRNAVLLSLAAGYAVSHGAGRLVVGEGQADAELFPDAKKSFFHAMAKALTMGLGTEIKIDLPLFGYTKGEGIKIGMKAVGTGTFLRLAAETMSCYLGTRCGDCPACVFRAQGFDEVGIEDPAL